MFYGCSNLGSLSLKQKSVVTKKTSKESLFTSMTLINCSYHVQGGYGKTDNGKDNKSVSSVIEDENTFYISLSLYQLCIFTLTIENSYAQLCFHQSLVVY